jgi:hypothetical protein
MAAAWPPAPLGNPDSVNGTNAFAAQQGRQDCEHIGVQVRPMTSAFAQSLGMAVPYGLFRREGDMLHTLDDAASPVPTAPAKLAGAHTYFVPVKSGTLCKVQTWGQVVPRGRAPRNLLVGTLLGL